MLRVPPPSSRIRATLWFASVLAAAATSIGAPQITGLSPTRQVLAPGDDGLLTVTASASGTPTYQWLHLGRPISGAIADVLSLEDIAYTDSGWYAVDVTDNTGTTRSAPIFVIVAPTTTQIRNWGSVATPPSSLTDAIDVTRIGGNAGLAIRRNGTLTAWGTDNLYQTTSLPGGLNDVVKLASGGAHVLALKADGTVVAWGHNFLGESSVPSGLTDVVDIAAAGGQSLAVKSDGSLVTWGQNMDIGENVIPTLSGTVAVSSGAYHSLALKTDGTVTAWGNDAYDSQFHMLDVPPGLQATALSAGAYHNLALKADGTVVAWGNNQSQQANVPANLTGVVKVHAGSEHSVALKADGSIVCWGSNSSGQIPAPGEVDRVFALNGAYDTIVVRDATFDTAPQFSTGPQSQTVAETGEVVFSATVTGGGPYQYQWRKNGVAITNATRASFVIEETSLDSAGAYDVIVTNLHGSVTSAVATLTVNALPVVTTQSALRQVLLPGQTATFNVTATGTGALSYQWLRNGRVISGAAGSALTVTNVTYADQGWYVANVTDTHGTRPSAPFFIHVAPAKTHVQIWRYPPPTWFDSMAQTTDIVAIEAGMGRALGIRADGSLVGAGSASDWTSLPAQGSNFVDLVIGSNANAGLRADGTVTVWGPYSPKNLAGLTGVVKISGDSSRVFALRNNGKVAAWETGNGNLVSLPPGLNDIIDISPYHALRRDGTVVSLDGNVPPPPNLNGVRAIESPYASHALALKDDGTVVAFGSSFGGLQNVPAGLAGITAISTGPTFSLALKPDGTLAGWGSELIGAPGALSDLTKVSQAIAIDVGYDTGMALRDATADILQVIAQPENASVISTQDARFAFNVAGPAVTYRWQWLHPIDGWKWIEDTNWSGTTSATLQIPYWFLSQFRSPQQFRCYAANGAGLVVSNPVTLTVRHAVAATGDFNHDGHTDLLWRNAQTGQVATWIMDGALFAGSISMGYVALDWQSAGTGDFNRDGHTDLLWRNVATGEVAVWYFDKTLFAGSVSLGQVSIDWQSLGTGDFNQDGHTDLLWRNVVTGEVAVWFLDRGVFAGSASVAQSFLEYQCAGTGDFNHDGQTDLLWRNGVDGRVVVWLMQGTTILTGVDIGVVASDWRSAGTGDFNRDGHTDLLWRHIGTGEVAVWFMDQNVFAGSASLGYVALDWQH